MADEIATTTAMPASQVIRLVTSLDTRARAVLLCLVDGRDLTSLVSKLHRRRSALQLDKERLARLVREHLGADIPKEVQRLPQWSDNLVANLERSACRYERRPA